MPTQVKYMDGGSVSLAEVRRTTVNAQANATTELVAAVTGHKIRLLGAAFSTASTQGFWLRSGASTPIIGDATAAIKNNTGTNMMLPLQGEGWADCAVGEALNLVNLDSASNRVGGVIHYAIVPADA